QRIDLGDGEALLSLELPPAFADDLKTFRLHPALFDLATGGAQALIPGFDPRSTFNVPFSYERVLINRPLETRVVSHVRLRDSAARDTAVFDVTVYDERGDELVVVEGFTMRRAAAGFETAAPTARASGGPEVPEVRSAKRPESASEATLRIGMTPAEGLDAL